MSYRILTKNGVDNTNIDAARAEFFNSGMRDGIVRGAFTEGTFSSNASNSVYLDSCELRISGHRVVIDEPVYKTFSNTPASNTRYSFVAQISVDSVSVVTFSIIIQDANTELRKDNLYATETGTGIYQIEIGRFTLTTGGTIIDIVRTADLITGGGEDENTYIEIGEVTTTTLNEGIDAEVDVENVIDEQTGKKKTNFHFGIPNASGTVVTVNGQHKETVNFDSEPQTQINELKSTNSTQGKDIDDLKNETLKKPVAAPAKRKIVGINTNNSQELIDLDEALSLTSENPVQNKVITAEFNKKVNESDILNKTYPVGAIYMSVNSTSPASLFGGQWEQFKDTFLLAHGDTYTSEKSKTQATAEAGAATVTLTVDQMPKHSHSIAAYGSGFDAKGSGKTANTDNTASFNTGSTGGGQAHNNMPPYLVVYMWKRTR